MAITDLNDISSAKAILGGLFDLPGAASVRTLAGNVTLDATYPSVLKLDPDGSARDVVLDAEEGHAGRIRWIINSAGGAENLVVKNDAAATIATINQNESAVFFCDGASWTLLAIVAIALS